MSLIGIGSIGRVNADHVLLMHLYINSEKKTNARIHIGEKFDNENIINLVNLSTENEKKFCESFLKTGNFIRLGEAIIINIKKISAIIFEKKGTNSSTNHNHFANYEDSDNSLVWAKIYFNNQIDNHFTIADLDRQGVKTIRKDIPKNKDLIQIGNIGVINKSHILTIMYNQNVEIFFGNMISSQNKLTITHLSKIDKQKFDNNLKKIKAN